MRSFWWRLKTRCLSSVTVSRRGAGLWLWPCLSRVHLPCSSLNKVHHAHIDSGPVRLQGPLTSEVSGTHIPWRCATKQIRKHSYHSFSFTYSLLYSFHKLLNFTNNFFPNIYILLKYRWLTVFQVQQGDSVIHIHIYHFFNYFPL